MIGPLCGHPDDLLLLILSVGSLVNALRPDVEYHLLYVLGTQCDQHAEEEVAIHLLERLQGPLVGYVL